jgi:hypothetical protein
VVVMAVGTLLVQVVVLYLFVPAPELHEIGSRFIAQSNLLYEQVTMPFSPQVPLNELVYDWLLHLELFHSSPESISDPSHSHHESSLLRPELWKYDTPISVEDQSRAMTIKLCQLNYEKYVLSPQLYPMFKSLVLASDCTSDGVGSLTERPMVSLQQEITEQHKEQEREGQGQARILYPTAFIFHESRVGSTLLANILTKDPFNLVYSEAAPPVSALFCGGCSEHTAMTRLIEVLTLMGRSPYHQRLFFKFQSIMTTKMHIILKARPPSISLSLPPSLLPAPVPRSSSSPLSPGLSRCSLDLSLSEACPGDDVSYQPVEAWSW